MELYKITTVDGQEYLLSDNGGRFLLNPTPAAMGLPPLDIDTRRNYQEDKLTVIQTRLQPRTLRLNHSVEGCTREDIFDKRQQLLSILHPNRGGAQDLTYTFTLDEGEGRQRSIKGRCTEIPYNSNPDSWDEFGIQDQIEITCYDPTWYDPDILSPILSIINDPAELSFPITFPISFTGNWREYGVTIAYTGTWYTQPTFIITGAADNILIYHNNSEKLIAYTQPIATSEVLTIDITARAVTSDIDGDRWAALSSVSDIREWKLLYDPLVTDGDNSLSVFVSGVDGNTAVEMSYYTRYLGI